MSEVLGPARRSASGVDAPPARARAEHRHAPRRGESGRGESDPSERVGDESALRDEAPDRTRGRRRWLVSFTLFTGIGVAWALATPIWGGPDEPSHAIHSAAIARGDLIGREKKGTPFVIVDVPAVYGSSKGYAECFAFRPEVTAECVGLPSGSGDRAAGTYTARYFPPYAFVLGVGSYWYPPGAGQIYLMRLLSLLIIAALLASCITTLTEVGSLAAAAGFLFALTPSLYFFAGVVNPNSPEMAAGVATWVHGAALATSRGDPEWDARLIRRLGIAACVFCATRPLSPMWVVFAGVLLACVAGFPHVRELSRRWVARGWAAAIALVALASFAWTQWAKPLAEGNTASKGLGEDLAQIARESVGKMWWSNLREMIGVFGWLDTKVPNGTIAIWLLVVGVLIGVAVVSAPRRLLIGLFGTLAVSLVVPIIIETSRANANGLVWHGRYTLPFAVGIPILAGFGARSAEDAGMSISRVARLAMIGYVAAQVLAYWQGLRRYAVGANGRLWFFFGDTRWTPPVPSALLLLAYVGLMVALVWWVFACSRRGDPFWTRTRGSVT